jgi:hypothetical protein
VRHVSPPRRRRGCCAPWASSPAGALRAQLRETVAGTRSTAASSCSP